MEKKIKINEFTLPQGNMIVRTRHCKTKFIELLNNRRINFINKMTNTEFNHFQTQTLTC